MERCPSNVAIQGTICGHPCRAWAILCVLLLLSAFIVSAFVSRLMKGVDVDEDQHPIFRFLENIFRVKLLIQTISSVCAILGIVMHQDNLIMPWLIFSGLEILQVLTLLTFYLVISECIFSLYYLCNLSVLCISYACIWKYFKQLRLHNSSMTAPGNPQCGSENGDRIQIN